MAYESTSVTPHWAEGVNFWWCKPPWRRDALTTKKESSSKHAIRRNSTVVLRPAIHFSRDHVLFCWDNHQKIPKQKPILQSFMIIFSLRGISKSPNLVTLKISSQHEDHGFDSDLSVVNLHALPVPAWVHTGHVGVQVCGPSVLILLGVTCLRFNTAGKGCSNHYKQWLKVCVDPWLEEARKPAWNLQSND